MGDGSTVSYHVKLTTKPLNNVKVTVSADPEASAQTLQVSINGAAGIAIPDDGLTFTRANYNIEQTVIITTVDSAPEDPAVTIKFEASGSDDYADVSQEVMFTIVNDDPTPPTNLKATAGTGTVTVEWDAPDTSTMPARYIVQLAEGASAPTAVTANTANNSSSLPYAINVDSGTSYTFMNVPAGVQYSCMVVAVFVIGDTTTFTAATDGATTSEVVG